MKLFRALGALLLLVPLFAHAQANFLFNGAGQSIATNASATAQRLIFGPAVAWSAGAAGSATARVSASAVLPGVGRLAGTAATTVTAGDLAGSAIAGLRGGVPGVVAAIVATAVLSTVALEWDQLRQQMMYNPQPTINNGPTQVKYFEYCTTPGHCGPSVNAHSYDAWAACAAFAAFYPAGSSSVPGPGGNMASYCVVTTPPAVNAPPGTQATVAQAQLTWEWRTMPGDGSKVCPNGVQWDDTTQCRQVLTDDQALPMLTPAVTSQNASTIGQAITNAGGQVQASALPQVQLQPASGPTTTSPEVGSNPPTSIQTHVDALPTCNNNKCAVATQTTQVQVDQNSQPTTRPPTVTTTNPGTDSGSPDDQGDLKVCGLDKGTACYINEAGVDSAMRPGQVIAQGTTDAIDAKKAAYDAVTGGGGLGGLGISHLSDFTAPTEHGWGAIDQLLPDGTAACTPFHLSYHGDQVIDICPIVNYAKPFTDWMFAVLTIAAIWRVFGSRRAGSGA